MEADAANDVIPLYDCVVACRDAWRMGYDALGQLYLLRSLELLERIIDRRFSSFEQDAGHLSRLLEEFNNRLKRKDIMAVQDLVQCELAALVQEWRGYE